MSQATLNLEPKFITRPIKKKLKEQGVNLLSTSEDPEKFDELMNTVLDMLYPDQTGLMDSVPYGDLQKLFQACMEKTFPSVETVEK